MELELDIDYILFNIMLRRCLVKNCLNKSLAN